jgi:hypothetical protein
MDENTDVKITDNAKNIYGPPPRSKEVESILEKNVTESYFVFPEQGGSRLVRRYEPRYINDGDKCALEDRLHILNMVLEPADEELALARIFALLAHYRSDPLPPSIERYVAEDWLEDMSEFPLWAIDRAARTWRRTKKFKPQISEMRSLCQQEIWDISSERTCLRGLLDKRK